MKKLWLFSCILIAAIVSCQRGLDVNGDNGDQDNPNENAEEERIQFDYGNIAVLGSLGPWLDEIMLSTESTYSTVGSETELVFTDVSQLIAQADSIFEAYENGAFIAVVNPDFSQMVASLSDWAEEMRLSPEDDTDDSPAFYAFGKNGMFTIEKTLFYEGAIRDSLGNEIKPESYTQIEECDYLSDLNSFAKWLADGFDTESSEETKASDDDKKPEISEILSSDKERIRIQQPFTYDVVVGDFASLYDVLRTRGKVTFFADFRITPMFGIESSSGSDEGTDYYFVKAAYSNSFGDVARDIPVNFRSELSEEQLSRRDNGLCVTYSCYKDNTYRREFKSGNDIHDYIYGLKYTWSDFHICGPMQKEFSFSTSLDLDEKDKYVSFDPEQGTPLPDVTIGDTRYEKSKTYSFGAGLSIGLGGGGGGMGQSEPKGKDFSKTMEQTMGGGDLSVGVDFNWGKQETETFSYILQDRAIRRTGTSGVAGWTQEFNNLPDAKGSNKFTRTIPGVALSNGVQKCSWVWYVPKTKRSSTGSVGKLKTDMSIRIRIICNATNWDVRDNSWDIGTTIFSRPIHWPARQVCGMVEMKNEIKNSTIKDICFISKESGKKTYIVLGSSSGGLSVNARIFEGKSIHFSIPEGTYSVQYTEETSGTNKTVTIDDQLIIYAKTHRMILKDTE